MTQKIRIIKAGQKFEVVGMSINGFDVGCVVEALNDTKDIKTTDTFAGNFKWVGGFKPQGYDYEKIKLLQNVKDLKRYKGKIK